MPDSGNHPHVEPRPVDLSLLLVTCNSRAALPGLTRSLRNSPPACRWELVVADNASTDDSVATVRAGISDLKLVQHVENRGFAAGVNAAARLARGEFLAIVNPDIEWDNDPFRPLLRLLVLYPQAAAVTPQLVFRDGRPQLSIRRFPNHRNIWWSRGTPWAGLLEGTSRARSYTQDYPEHAARIDAASAACLVVRRTAFDSIGGMDEGYFLYVEDTDLCRRLHDAGWEIWCEPEVRVRHAWSAESHRDRWHARQHRRGLRRYFQKFYPRDRLKNAFLFGALSCAAAIEFLRPQAAGERRQ